jgi:hypothetical protein
MMASVNTTTNRLEGSVSQQKAVNELLSAALTDLTALRTSIVAVTAKLDADGGVSGTDFAATCDPAALTVTE